MIPDELQRIFDRADPLVAAGRIDEAERLLLPALDRFGAHPALFERLNGIFRRVVPPFAISPLPAGAREGIEAAIEAGDAGRALTLAKKANAAAPHQVYPLHAMARILLRQQRFSEALPLVHFALIYDPTDAVSLSYLAQALRGVERFEEAYDAAEMALARNPDDPGALWLAGEAATSRNRPERAIAHYRRLVGLMPELAEAHRLLSRLLDYSGPEDHFETLQALRDRFARDPAALAHVEFARAKAFADRGDRDREFAALEAGNAARRATIEYDPDAGARQVAAIRASFEANRDTLSALAAEPADGPRPIFVVGLPRTGSTLTEQILASHSQVAGLGELGLLGALLRELVLPDPGAPLDPDKLRAVRAKYLGSATDRAAGKPAFTDKMPINYRWSGFILSLFPDARIINLRRDPVATGWSIYRQYFGFGNLFAYSFEDIAKQYRTWRDTIGYWKAQFPGAIHDLDYARLTEAPEATIRQLLDHARLPFEPACLEFHATERSVATASDLQVRQPVYKGSDDDWKAYARHLRPLGEALLREGVIDTLPLEMT